MYFSPSTSKMHFELDSACGGLMILASAYRDSENGGELVPGFTHWDHWVYTWGNESSCDTRHLVPLENGEVWQQHIWPEDGLEEIWLSAIPQRTGPHTHRLCFVLEHHVHQAGKSKGMLIRVGNVILGLLKKDGAISVQRWDYMPFEVVSHNIYPGSQRRLTNRSLNPPNLIG